jgi:DNA topoisomerase VI subunit B
MSSKIIFVKSHVSRDLLQNAALFKTDKLVIWEYVANGLQYVDPGTSPTVYVRLDSKGRKIRISDNGRGMTLDGLQNFFVMHGENLDRKSGVPGRGRFGTGKSAAFGIGDLLRVTSVRGSRRSVVELTRSDLDKVPSGNPIPVRVLVSEVPCSEVNGTIVEIEQIHLQSLDQPGCIRYIERHLAKWPKNC